MAIHPVGHCPTDQPCRKHVFRDLQPYVCTQKNCRSQDVLFHSQHEWYSHELEIHHRMWYCKSCLQEFSSPKLFEEHLLQTHSDILGTNHRYLAPLVDLAERVGNPSHNCEICGRKVAKDKRKKHIGRHMQKLALFVLPSLQGSTSEEMYANFDLVSPGFPEPIHKLDPTLQVQSTLKLEPTPEVASTPEVSSILEFMDSGTYLRVWHQYRVPSGEKNPS